MSVIDNASVSRTYVGNALYVTQWHSLSREEQAKYYEKARQERQLHMQLYPGWSARDNYGYGSKKKKRKKDRSPAELGGTRTGNVAGWGTSTLLYTRFTHTVPPPPRQGPAPPWHRSPRHPLTSDVASVQVPINTAC